MYFIAVDLGATYIKSCLVESKNFSISAVHRERFPEKETNFEVIFAVVRRVLDFQLKGITGCAGIFFSNQMHGVCLANSNGEIVSPFISWQDQRCAVKGTTGISSFEKIQKLFDGFSWELETGEYLRVGFPITQLFHLKCEGALTPGLTPIDLGNAVAGRLARVSVFKIDASNASAMGCYDLKNGAWHESLIAGLGLSDLEWPEIVESHQTHGSITHQGKTVPVYLSVGDQQASLLGAGLRACNQISCNIATGSQVSILSGALAPGDFQTRPYFGKYLRTITHIPAGRSLNALLRLFLELNPGLDFDAAWERVGQLVEKTLPDDSLEFDLSFFPSAFGSSGHLNGLTEKNLNIGNLMQAALRALAKAHQRGFQRLIIGQDHSFVEILGSGGVLKKSIFLQKVLKQQFDLSLQLSPQLEDALIGNALRAKQSQASESFFT